MAIHNGSHDFNLKCSQSGKKGISVSWKKAGGIGYDGVLTITRAKDNKVVLKKNYGPSVASDSFVFECDTLAEYEVKIKSSVYLHDYVRVKVFLNAVETKTFTYTVADVQKQKEKGFLELGILVSIGLLLTITSAVLTILMGVASSETPVRFPSPRVGDKITTTCTPKTGGFETVVEYKQKAYTDDSGASQSGGTFTSAPVTRKYLVF